MNNKKAKVLILLGFIITILSLSYIKLVDNRMISKKKEVEKSKNQFIEERKEEKALVKENTMDENILIYMFDRNQKEEEKKPLKKEIGYIEIDSLDLLLPIYPDTSYQALKEGVGVVEGTDIPDVKENITSVIAGHRGGYNGEDSFLNIDKLKKGDYIKVVEDRELIYEVIGQEVIESTDWEKFTKEEDQSKLILLTCHPYPINDKRLIIKTKLIDIKSI